MTTVVKPILRTRSKTAEMHQSREDVTPKIMSILASYYSGEDSSSFVQLVKQIEGMEVEEVQLKDWLVLFRENLHYLDIRSEALVMSLLRLEWWKLNSPTVREYSAFVLSLVSAHTCYLNAVFLMLIKNFYPTAEEKTGNASNLQSTRGSQMQTEVARYALSHAILRGICQLVPMAPSLVIPLVSKGFPYMRNPVRIQEHYVSNMLELIAYMPSQRSAILEIIIDRLTKLDVNSPKQEIIEAEAKKQEAADIQTVFEMDVEVDDEQMKAKPLDSPNMEHELANTLDTLMLLMMKFIRTSCFSKDSGDDLNWDVTKMLFLELWTIFEKLILPTHDCSHVQFLLFYFCSLKISLSELFLDLLWKKVQNPNTSSILRQASVAYIGSFVSRAMFVPISIVATSLELMCNWIHRYISSQVECAWSYSDITLHGPFYSICQTVFYTFAFRHQELVEIDKGFGFLRRLGFERIVTCRLNPLKVCLPVVARNFAAVSRNHQLAYCYTILEKNQRSVLPVVSYKENNGDSQVTTFNPLDSFFPFDPYFLKKSSEFITPLYRHYQGLVEDESPSPEVDDDDFLVDDEPATISSSHLSNSSLTELFTYSLSPGFKHSFPT